MKESMGMTMAEVEYTKAKTSVWWDMENCEVPRGSDAHEIAKNVSSALFKMNYCGPLSISTYGDTILVPHLVQQALSSTGVGLNHVPAGVKDASDKKILVDMMSWAIDNPAPANIMLISGDRDFSNALHQLSMRRYNILLAQPLRASAPLVSAAKTVWLWTSLASGGPPLPSGESFGLVNNGRCHVSKGPVFEQAPSNHPTDSTSEVVDTTDKNTGENHGPKGLSQETRGNMLQNGRGATSCDNFSDKRHTSQKQVNNKKAREGKAKPKADHVCSLCNVVCQSQVVFDSHLKGKKHAAMLRKSEAVCVGSDDAQSDVSSKPQKQPDIFPPVWGQVCQISFNSKVAYANHTYGKKHRQKLEVQSTKNENMSTENADKKKVLCKNQTTSASHIKINSTSASTEFIITKELRKCLDVNPERVQLQVDVNVSQKLENPEPKSQEPKNECQT